MRDARYVIARIKPLLVSTAWGATLRIFALAKVREQTPGSRGNVRVAALGEREQGSRAEAGEKRFPHSGQLEEFPLGSCDGGVDTVAYLVEE